jgi:ParB/RepB/Spo0J family partition protein
MLGDDNPITPMGNRRFKLIPVDSIIVPNPRKRCAEQFHEIMRSIKEVGLQKPIMVNERNFKSNGKKYELIYGQGRWEIYKILGIEFIWAEIVNVEEGKAYILSLVENIARSRPQPIEFAKAIIQMYDSGVTIKELARITGRCKSGITEYINLMKKGERSLIKGVEKGIFPISFAKQVAKCDDLAPQSVLMEAFEEGIITESNIVPVRKILERRKMDLAKNHFENLKELTTGIQDASEQIRIECDHVKKKQSRLFQLLYLIQEVKKDVEVVRLAKEQGVSLTLKLNKDYYKQT